ncbi:unnamed protein product [Linum tenue]|uniref:Uncharacterized protein n=1 Tax=Linum tenue TaxID=586396 RepID=A0AAV0HXD0_9ROSI|nr:unnamed protein product [Linum tenue]
MSPPNRRDSCWYAFLSSYYHERCCDRLGLVCSSETGFQSGECVVHRIGSLIDPRGYRESSRQADHGATGAIWCSTDQWYSTSLLRSSSISTG